MLFIMRQTCQATIFSLTIFRLLPTAGSGLLFILLLFVQSNLSLLSLELLWNLENAVAPERLLWCLSLSLCVYKKSESVVFSITLSDHWPYRGDLMMRPSNHTYIHATPAASAAYRQPFLNEQGCMLFKAAYVCAQTCLWLFMYV